MKENDIKDYVELNSCLLNFHLEHFRNYRHKYVTYHKQLSLFSRNFMFKLMYK